MQRKCSSAAAVLVACRRQAGYHPARQVVSARSSSSSSTQPARAATKRPATTQARSTSTAGPVRGVHPESSSLRALLIATATALSWPGMISAQAASLAHSPPRPCHCHGAGSKRVSCPSVASPQQRLTCRSHPRPPIRRITVVRLCKGKKALSSVSLCLRRHSVHGALS